MGGVFKRRYIREDSVTADNKGDAALTFNTRPERVHRGRVRVEELDEKGRVVQTWWSRREAEG